MGNWNPTLVTPTRTDYTAAGSGAGPSAGGLSLGELQAHHGLYGIVLVSVAVLVILNYAGFRFVFTAGKR